MTAEEINYIIRTYKRKISQLNSQNSTYKKNISQSEKAYEEINKKIEITERKFESVLQRIKHSGRSVPNTSDFANQYYNKMKRILGGSNANSGLESLKRTKRSILNKINDYDYKINNNNRKIEYYKAEIKKLETQLASIGK